MSLRRLSRPIALLFAAACGGCSLVTVEATSGTGELSPDLRSSSDDVRPLVGVADLPTTRPGALASVGRSVRAVTVNAPQKVYEMMTAGNLDELRANAKSDDADVRRVALSRIASRSTGRGEASEALYRTLAQTDGDGLVRATAIRAINHARDESGEPVLVAALADGHPQVRLEAAKALANLPTPAAEQPLRGLAQANDQDVDTRLAALDALRHYPTLDTQRLLASQLQSNNFALAWQSRRSLCLQTGADFRYDESAWLNYISSR